MPWPQDCFADPFSYILRNLKEFRTTVIDEKAMAPEAIIGDKVPNAAIGIAITL